MRTFSGSTSGHYHIRLVKVPTVGCVCVCAKNIRLCGAVRDNIINTTVTDERSSVRVI